MHRLLLIICIVFLASTAVLAGVNDGLVGHWDFTEGKGVVLHDRTGNGNDGAIHGAKWVQEGDVYSLAFDGLTDFVDCGAGPSLDLKDQVSVTCWAKFRPMLKDGEAGIVGKSCSNYLMSLSDYTIIPYANSPASIWWWGVVNDRWDFLAMTYDGKVLSLYVNGKLMNPSAISGKMAGGGHFWMAKSDSNPTLTKNAHFHGQLTDVRVYSRPLTTSEIQQLYETTNRNRIVDIPAVASPGQRAILIEANGRGLGESVKGASLNLSLVSDDPSAVNPAWHDTVSFPKGQQSMCCKIKAGDLPAGEYEVHAMPVDKLGNAIGRESVSTVRWPGMEKFPNGPAGARRLNNLVTELLNVRGTGSSGKKYSFVNPKNGWIYVANKGSETVVIASDGGKPQEYTLSTKYMGANEMMRNFPAGKYSISTALARDLVVRSVPDIVYCTYSAEPVAIKHFGPYAGAFEHKYVFPHVNTLNCGDLSPSDPFVQEWKSRGGRWLVETGEILQSQPKEPNADNIYKYLNGMAGYNRQWSSGIYADEFVHSEPVCSLYARGIRRMKSDPEFKDKVFYAWGQAGMENGPDGRELMKALMDTDGRYSPEIYLSELATEFEQLRRIDIYFVDYVRSCNRQVPGSASCILPTIGYFNAKNSSLDVLPSVNYKTDLEMEFNTIATHPDLKGIGGISTYLSSFTTEEMIRFGAQLFRHYCIEGKTDMLSKDPYILTHLKNPDFDEGDRNWMLSPAEAGSMMTSSMQAYGFLQGRAGQCEWGNSVLVTKRSGTRPNVFSQEIVDLTPGRLYSLEIINADYKDLTVKDIRGVSIDIADVDFVPEKCFDEVFHNHAVHSVAPYSATNPAWMNYHFRVFKARGTKARLTVSDWASKENPGGPIGQQLMFNYVQLEPYFMN